MSKEPIPGREGGRAPTGAWLPHALKPPRGELILEGQHRYLIAYRPGPA